MGQQAHVIPTPLSTHHVDWFVPVSLFQKSGDTSRHTPHTTAPSSIPPSHTGADISPEGQSLPHHHVPRVHCRTLHQAMDMCLFFLMYFTHTNCDEK